MLSSQRGAYKPASCLRGSVNDTPSARKPRCLRRGGCHVEEFGIKHFPEDIIQNWLPDDEDVNYDNLFGTLELDTYHS